MARLTRVATSCVLLVGIAAACGARTGLPIPECSGQPLKRINGPNIYFILDRSKSMTERVNGMEKWSFVRDDIADLIVALGSEAQFGAAEFPLPSADPALQCQAGTEVMALRQGDGLPATATGSTANTFMNATSYGPGGGTPTAATFTALTPELTSFKGHTFAILATDGGPNCNESPNETCSVETCTVNIDTMFACKAVSGAITPCVPGGLNCCDTATCGGTPLNCLDDVRTVAAVDTLAHPVQGQGVPTFVIGVPGSEAYGPVLDRVASAGGTARAEPPLYYPVTDSDLLASALADISARIAASCAIELEQPPSDPSQVNLVLNGHVIPQEGANGWTISGSFVTVLGASCDEVHSIGRSPIVTGGCPTVQTLPDSATP